MPDIEYLNVTYDIADLPRAAMFFLFGVRKSGSSVLNQVVQAMGERAGIRFIDVAGRLFGAGRRVGDWQHDPGLATLLRPGNLYGGFRNFPFGLAGDPRFQQAPKVLLVRDPRDALVSEYFSNAFSHGVPQGGDTREQMLRLRREALGGRIDEVVLRRAPAMAQTLRDYAPLLADRRTLLLRYEDFVADMRPAMGRIAAHFGWFGATDRAFVDGVLAWAQQRPEGERPAEFVRKVTPGDHREKLAPATIARLDVLLRAEMQLFGYLPPPAPADALPVQALARVLAAGRQEAPAVAAPSSAMAPAASAMAPAASAVAPAASAVALSVAPGAQPVAQAAAVHAATAAASPPPGPVVRAATPRPPAAPDAPLPPRMELALRAGPRVVFDIPPPDARLPAAVFVLGVRKSGSTLLNQAWRELLGALGLPWVDVGGGMFDQDVRAAQWLQDPAVAGLFAAGRVYGGFRNAYGHFAAAPVFARSPKVLLVRDPRDALVSQYFSALETHSLPPERHGGAGAAQQLLRQREAARALGIDDYVLLNARSFREALEGWVPLLADPRLRLFRYEDVVLDKGPWLRAMLAHAGLSAPQEVLAAVLQRLDVVPAAEDPSRFIRKVVPGDHAAKLRPATIEALDLAFGPVAARFGYRLA